MFCTKCGAEISEGNKFCQQCGTPAPGGEAATGAEQQPDQPIVTPTPVVATPEAAIPGGEQAPAGETYAAPASSEAGGPTGQTYTAPQGPAPMFGEAAPAYAVGQPADGGKKNKFKLPIIIGAIVLVLALLAALLIPRLLASMSPTTYVMTAFGKTFATMGSEWKDTAKTLGLEGYSEAYEAGRAHTRTGFELSGMAGEIDRVGFNFEAWTDFEARRMEGTAGLAMSGISLVELQYGLDDNLLWAEMPALFAGTYGVDTETIGQDMDSFYGGYGFYDDFSFNLFDIYHDAKEAAASVDAEDVAMLAQTAEKITGLWLVLLDEIDTTKMDKTTVDVNGIPRDVEEYYMLIPGEALGVYFRGLGDALIADPNFMEYMDTMLDAYATYDYYMSYYTSAEMVDELVEELADTFSGGVRANIYIKDGCVLRAEGRFAPYGKANWEQLVQLEFGDGEALINNITLTFGEDYNTRDDSDMYIFTWSGQHKPVDGVFTSNLHMTNEYYGQEYGILDASFKWDSKGDFNNLSFSIGAPDGDYTDVFTGRGTLAIDGKTGTFNLKLDNMTYDDGWDTYTFAIDYFSEPFESYDFTDKTPKMLLAMSEAELEKLYEEISRNAMMLFMSMAL